MVAVLALSRLAHAAPDPDDWRMGADSSVRVLSGVGEDRGLTLGIATAGVGFVLAPAIRLRTQWVLLVPAGRDVEGSRAAPGTGGELELRIDPWSPLRVRPVFGVGAGLLLFPGRPFLPGASSYEFLLTYGLGATAQLSPRWDLTLDARYSHLSNGQGLGPHNPAFDGVGAGLTASWSFGDRVVEPLPLLPRSIGRSTWVPGALAETNVGRVGDVALLTERVWGFERVHDHIIVALDGEVGSLSGHPVGRAGGTLLTHFTRASIAGGLSHTWFVGIRTLSATAQAEIHATSNTSLVAAGTWDAPSLFAARSAGALAMRLFVTEGLRIDFGVGTVSSADGWRTDPVVALEGQLPLQVDPLAVSLFAERRVGEIDVVGLRVGVGAGDTLRVQARTEAWRPLR